VGFLVTLHVVFVITSVYSFTSGPFNSSYSYQAHSDFLKFLVIFLFRCSTSAPNLVSEWHQAKHVIKCLGTIKGLEAKRYSYCKIKNKSGCSFMVLPESQIFVLIH
jgi:hypothetical protein